MTGDDGAQSGTSSGEKFQVYKRLYSNESYYPPLFYSWVGSTVYYLAQKGSIKYRFVWPAGDDKAHNLPSDLLMVLQEDKRFISQSGRNCQRKMGLLKLENTEEMRAMDSATNSALLLRVPPSATEEEYDRTGIPGLINGIHKLLADEHDNPRMMYGFYRKCFNEDYDDKLNILFGRTYINDRRRLLNSIEPILEQLYCKLSGRHTDACQSNPTAEERNQRTVVDIKDFEEEQTQINQSSSDNLAIKILFNRLLAAIFPEPEALEDSSASGMWLWSFLDYQKHNIEEQVYYIYNYLLRESLKPLLKIEEEMQKFEFQIKIQILLPMMTFAYLNNWQEYEIQKIKLLAGKCEYKPIFNHGEDRCCIL